MSAQLVDRFRRPVESGRHDGPPTKPSSVTSVHRTTGVQMDFIHARSTPGSRKTSSLILANCSRNRFRTDHRWRFRQRCAPNRRGRAVRSVLQNILDVRMRLRSISRSSHEHQPAELQREKRAQHQTSSMTQARWFEDHLSRRLPDPRSKSARLAMTGHLSRFSVDCS